MIKSEKSHDTGLRILEILKILLDGDADKKSIIDKLKINNEITNAYSNEAYLKYFNTFELLGLDFTKTQDGYSLKNALFHFDLTKEEENAIMLIIKSIPKLNNTEWEETVLKVMERLDKYVDIDIKSKLKKPDKKLIYTESIQQNIIDTLKQIMEENLGVIITYKKRSGAKDVLKGKIKRIIYNKGKSYVVCTNSDIVRGKRIYINSIISTEKDIEEKVEFKTDNSVVYELYGRLAKSYRMREWETLESFDNECIRIINTQEDIETLLHRLLKYGENCKIIKPQNIVNNFLSLTDEILKNLESEEDLKDFE